MIGKVSPSIKLRAFFIGFFYWLFFFFYTYGYYGKERRDLQKSVYMLLYLATHTTCCAVCLLLVWLAGILEGKGQGASSLFSSSAIISHSVMG